ncbi:unnamed protein product [Cuscuta campestris]|uniref:Uncharacterized protein n=1 Tax=Cuscuta campestris TaxID=132261 RepID=A0A484MB78_9ASTE|nr:unnamed protein product [Cuscuta campestris]
MPHKVDEQGSVSGPHRKRGRPKKRTAKLPQSTAQGKLKRKKVRSSKTVVRTPDVLVESQISGFSLNAVEAHGKENVESVPMEKAVSEGPVPMEKAISKGPIPMEKAVGEGPIPMEKAVSEGSAPMDKAVSEGPIPVEKVVCEGHSNGSEDDQPLSTWVGKVHTRTPVDGSRLAQPHQSLPFVKKDALIWDILESREAFQKIPQNPHFQPLQHSENFRRETLAIFYMCSFADLVDKACHLKLDEPRNTIDKMFDTLAELETHGFSVEPIRSRLKEILSYREEHENLQVSSAGTRSEMEKQSALKVDLMKQKAELEKSLSQVVAKLESKEKDIASLQSSVDEMNERLGHLSRDYEALICKPFEPPVQNV